MYLSHYKLNEKPFQMTADPKFIWLGKKHAEALVGLQNGLHQNKGFSLLTGNVGTGKTVVLNTLLKKIDEKVIAVKIPDPGLSTLDLYNILSNELKMNAKFRNKENFLNHFKTFLYEINLEGKILLLIFDEAQNISFELLEEIRQLSNIESADKKLIHIFLAAQNEFNAILDENRNKALQRSIGIRYHLDSLTDSETGEYITHRLKVAGSDKEIFSAKAIGNIHFFSAGFPRLINAICDLALLAGYSSGKDRIDENIINKCADELKLSGKSKIANAQKINRSEASKQSAADGYRHPGIRKFDLAAAIVGVILFLIFAIFDFYPLQSQPQPSAAEAFRDYKRYQEKIEYTKIAHAKEKLRLVNKVSEASNSVQKLNKNKVKKNIGSKNGFRPNEIIYFQATSQKLSKENLETLAILAESLRNYPNSEIIIEGHTDSHGNYWRNKKLSKFRANLVKNYLINHGIIAARIKTIGSGAEYPIANIDAEIGKLKNHRVEIKYASSQQNFILSQSR